MNLHAHQRDSCRTKASTYFIWFFVYASALGSGLVQAPNSCKYDLQTLSDAVSYPSIRSVLIVRYSGFCCFANHRAALASGCALLACIDFFCNCCSESSAKPSGLKPAHGFMQASEGTRFSNALEMHSGGRFGCQRCPGAMSKPLWICIRAIHRLA